MNDKLRFTVRLTLLAVDDGIVVDYDHIHERSGYGVFDMIEELRTMLFDDEIDEPSCVDAIHLITDVYRRRYPKSKKEQEEA